MKLLPDTIITSWLAARRETSWGEKKKAEFRERFLKEPYSTFPPLNSGGIFFLIFNGAPIPVDTPHYCMVNRGEITKGLRGKWYPAVKAKLVHSLCCGLKPDGQTNGQVALNHLHMHSLEQVPFLTLGVLLRYPAPFFKAGQTKRSPL